MGVERIFLHPAFLVVIISFLNQSYPGLFLFFYWRIFLEDRGPIYKPE